MIENEMVKSILDNLTNVGWAALIFLCAYLSNMAFGLYHNVKQLGQAFEIQRLKNSGLKLASLIFGSILLVIAITVLPEFANYVGWKIPEEYSDVFNNLIILGICLYMSCKYIFEAFGKFKDIISDNTLIQNETIVKQKIQS